MNEPQQDQEDEYDNTTRGWSLHNKINLAISLTAILLTLYNLFILH